jgi:hypothetical protein
VNDRNKQLDEKCEDKDNEILNLQSSEKCKAKGDNEPVRRKKDEHESGLTEELVDSNTPVTEPFANKQ